MTDKRRASGITGSDGYTPVTRDDVTDLALLPRRFDLFASEVQSQLEVIGKLILPLLTEVRDLVKHHGDRLHDHSRRLTALELGSTAGTETIGKHGERLDGHDAKHVQHVDQITGIHKRIVLLEETFVIKSKPRPRRKKRK